MGARREVVSAVVDRYRSAKRSEKRRILDELCATTGWHRKHAVRALRQRTTITPGEVVARSPGPPPGRTYVRWPTGVRAVHRSSG